MIIEPNYGLKCHCGYKILPKNVIAITLFGHIFFRMSEEEFMKYLETNTGVRTMHHEYLHVLQAESFKTRYLGFYIYYLYYYFKGIFGDGLNRDMAYYHIPFEQEAYEKEGFLDYRETHWRDYIG